MLEYTLSLLGLWQSMNEHINISTKLKTKENDCLKIKFIKYHVLRKINKFTQMFRSEEYILTKIVM